MRLLITFSTKKHLNKPTPKFCLWFCWSLGSKGCVLAQESCFWTAPCCTDSKQREAAALQCWVLSVWRWWEKTPRHSGVQAAVLPLLLPLQIPPPSGCAPAAGCCGVARGSLCLPLHGFREPQGLGVACSALCPWRSILVSVNVHVLEKICVAQSLTCHCYLFIFFYFKRKHLQIVLPWSEMYLMPKALFFVSWLYIWLTWWGKEVKPVTLRGCFCCCPCWRGISDCCLACSFPRKGAGLDPHCTELKELLPFLPLAAD